MTKKALIVELNPYHGEILPGFVSLFQKAGYATDILIRKEVAKEHPFTRFPERQQPTIIAGSLEFIVDELKNGKTNEYDVVLFASNVLWEPKVNVSSVFRYLGFIPSARIGTLFIEHNLSYLDMDDSTMMMENDRVMTLLPYRYQRAETTMFNPHYYGEVSMSKRKLGKKKRILVIGASNKETYVRNIINYAVRQHKEEAFEIVLVNGGAKEIPAEIEDKVIVTPRLSFREYFDYIESSDFVLTVFNSDNPVSDKYLNGTTSGTVQISLGFCKPMIIDQLHAKQYGMSGDESVQFSFNDLPEGLERALSMSDEQYQTMRGNLKRKSGEMNAKSLSNLKEMIAIMHSKGRQSVEAVNREAMTIIEKTKELEETRLENERLKRKVDEQEAALAQLRKETQDLKVHVNELWVHLHSKHFVFADRLYGKLNSLLPQGSFRRRVGLMPLRAARYVKRTPDRKLQRQKEKFREDFKTELLRQANTHESLIIYISMPWDNIMRQRPHHIAEQLAERGHLVVYMDYEAEIPRHISDNLVVVDSTWCFDLLKDAKTAKYFMLPAGYNMPYEDVRSILDKGYSLIYEYIDELDETISGDLTNQIEVFKRLEELKPALLIASAKRLYVDLEKRFPKSKIIMNANAVDINHFDMSIKRYKKDAPIDLKPILDLGRPIVGYYGAIAPWLDYELINELTYKHNKDISFVFIGVNYNDGLKNLLTYDNVFFLGPKDYNDLPNYSYWFDAAIIPFQRGDIAKSTSPVKLFEYMAMGLPTVCTHDLLECKGYDHVYMSKDINEFEKNLQKAIKHKKDQKSRKVLVQQAKRNTWGARAEAISSKIKQRKKK